MRQGDWRPDRSGRGSGGLRNFKMETMVCGAQAHLEADNGGTAEFGHLEATGGLASVGERWGDSRKGGDMESQRCAVRGRREVGASGEKVASKMGSEGTRVGLWPQGQEGWWERGLLRCAVLKGQGLGGTRRGNLDRPDGLPRSDQEPWKPLGLPAD